MAQQLIDTTTDHGSYKGDPAKVAFEKVNANDAELYGLLTALAAVGGENMLINCGVPINQRGFAGGALAAGAYGYDRWKAGSGGCNVTINATTGVFTHTSGPLQQIIEAPVLAWGLPLTISVENPSGNIAVNVGGATGTITAGTGRRGVTLTPSGSGNMTVQMTATGVSYSRPKLERGEAATPYQPRPVEIELALCRRYYCKSFPVGTPPAVGLVAGCAQGATAWSTANVRTSTIAFPTEMRALPALLLYTSNDASTQGNGAALWNGSVWNSTATWTFDLASSRGFAVNGNFGSGLTVNGSYLMRFNWTADAEL